MKATLVCLIGSAAGVLACPSSRQLYTQGNGKPSAKNRGDTHTYQLHAYQYLLFLRACIRSWLPAVGTHLAQTQYAFSNLAGGSHYWTVVATLVHGTPEVKTLIPANYSIVAETTIKHTLTTPIWYNAQTVYECFDLIQTHNDSAPRFKDKTAHASNATPTPGVGKRQRDPDPRWIGKPTHPDSRGHAYGNPKQTRPDSHASAYGHPKQTRPDSRGHAYGNPTQPPSTTQCFMVDGRSFRMVPTSPDRKDTLTTDRRERERTTPYGPPKDAPSRHRDQPHDRHDHPRASPSDQRRRDDKPLSERNNRERSARGRKRR